MGTGESRIIQVTLKAVADMSDVTSNVRQIQNLLSQLKLSPNLKGDFTKIFGDIEKNMERASQAMANGFKTKGDVKAYSTAMEAIERALISMQTNMEKIKPGAFSELLKDNQDLQAALQASATQLQTFKQELASKIAGTDAFKELNKDIDTFKNGIKSASVDTFFKKLGEGDIPGAEKALKRLDAVVEKQKKDLQAKGMTTGWEESEKLVERLRQGLQGIASDGGVQNVRQQMTELEQSMKNMSAAELDKLKKDFEQLTGVDLGKLIEEFKRLKNAEIETGNAQQKVNSELDQLKSRISYFLGMTNSVMLFRRALRSTFETVKDLDKVMTETAVVTEFDVGDMWSQLPEYTERANQLGISIHDAYEAATLYYQQGLSTNEVMAVSNETLKMARIAGLDAAEATDRMTNALRGFNMEITESNAQNINDVYSNLAAKTASNVDEISTAMTKVASLAHNANMSFENTAAFLSQIIETTRESAETAGTALKTVIARFSEVKKLYSTGDLLGTDEEGEEINVNKVSAALRTAGINLNEYLTGMKGLDEIFMELSEKWDNLDQVQQRYIATMAAGSRQQSRFIALMQDNARMTELVNYANNAAGASEKQFEKTLESLESKLNQLKNTWKTFLMGIANSDIIKTVVDALTSFLNTVNKITGKLPGFLKSIANIGIIFGSLRLTKGIFEKMSSSIGLALNKASTDASENAGKQASLKWISSYTSGIQNSTAVMQNEITNALQNATPEQQSQILMTFKTEGYEAAKAQAEEMGYSLDNVSQKTKEFEAVQKRMKVGLGAVGMAFTSLGLVINRVGKLFDDGTERGKAWSKNFEKVGNVVTAIGASILSLSMITKTFGAQFVLTAKGIGIETAKAGMIGQAGWLWVVGIAAAIGVLVYGIIQANKNSPEKKLEKVKKNTESITQAAQEAKEKYESLNSSINSLKEQYSTLDTLTRGTEDWRDAVKETNEKALELIGTFKDLSNYVTFEDGVLKIDFENPEVQEILDSYEKAASRSSVAQEFSQYTESKAELDVKRNKVAAINMSGYTQVYDETMAEERDLLAKALAHNAEALQEIEDKYQINIKEIADPKKYVEKYTTALGIEVPGGTVSGKINDKGLETFTEYGYALLDMENQTEGLVDSILLYGTTLSDLSDEIKGYAFNFFDTDMIDSLYQNALKGVENASDTELKEEFARGLKYDSYSDYVEKNGEIEDKDYLKSQVAAMRAYDDLVLSLDGFEDALNKMPDVLKRVYEKSEGQAITFGDVKKGLKGLFAEISGVSIEDIENDQYWNKRYGTWLSTSEGLNATQAYNFAGERFGPQEERLSNAGIQLDTEQFDALESGQVEGLVNKLLSVVSSSGSDMGQELTDEIGKVLSENVPEEFKDSFLTELNNLDWNDINAVDAFRARLEEIGIVLKISDKSWEDFISKIKEGADSIRKFDLSALEEQFDDLVKIRKEIEKDKNYTLSEDEYNAVVAAYAAAGQDISGDFFKDEEGKYQYIGGSMEDLAAALKENTNAVLQGTRDQLNAKIGVSDILSDMKKRGITADKYSNEQMFGYLKTAAISRGVELKDLGIEGLSNDTRVEDLEPDKLDSILEQILAILEEDLVAEEEAQGRKEAQMTARNNTAQENASMVDTEYGDEYIKALKAQAYAAGVDAKEITGLIEALEGEDRIEKIIAAQKLANLTDLQKEIELYGLDAEQVKMYADNLMASNEVLAQNPALAMEVAVANTRLNEGYKEIVDSYDDWTALIDSSTGIIKTAGSEDQKVFNNLKKSVNKMLGSSEDLSDAFWNNAKNIQLIKDAADGVEGSLEDLQKAAAEDYAVNIALDSNASDTVISEIQTLFDGLDIPDIEVGTQVSNEGFIEACNEIIRNAGLTADQANELFAKMGFEAEFEENPMPITGEMKFPGVHYHKSGDVGGGLQVPADLEPTIDEGKVGRISGTVPAPSLKVKTLTSTGSGGKGISSSNKPHSSGGGGGGGCFAAGTLVTLQGFYKNIEQVSVGDVVLSYNEEKKRNEYSTVVQTMIHLVKEKIYTLYVGRDKLVVTGIHRFYITREEGASWIPAEELCVGDKVRFADGTLHDITKISTEEKSLIVYNFEVSNTHNYYVGRSQILAHNKGGGGGGSDKTEHWDNPYDELFNLQEKINGAIRKRNKLEEKYNDLIRSSKGATKDLQKENKNILKNLQTQLSLQKDMRKGRLKQIRNVGKETYYNGDKATTFEKMNVTKYASLNTSTGEVKINWKALNKLSGKTDKDSIATGQAAEAYISRLQELADQLNETNDTIRDIKEEIREQHQQNLDNVTEFQQRAMDAYIDSKEREIDAIEELYDSIEESTQNVLQGIQDQIAEQRKARENEKTEKDLADKEARLAYLQRDTSGANQAEIMSLQKEIDEARQDYEDTLIDQTIDQMSKDADLAAEQRAKQIEIMREQLDTAKENGTYWKKVNQMINDSRNKGVINKQSDLWKMIEQSESYKGMSKQQQYAFRKELLEQENSAFAGVKDTNTEMVFTTKQREAIATAIAKGTKKNDYNGWGSGKTRTKRLTDLFGSNDAKAIENLVKNKGKKLNTGKPADNEYGDWKKKMQGFTVYKTGGLADFTGPAWLDGTKTKPEIILNAADSKNLIILKDVLASLLSGKNSSNSKDNGGDNYFDIDITAELKNDYDVDQLAARIKKQIQQDGQYRNVNAISFLR